MILAVPDLITNSYFPAIAAVELGFFRDEGLDVRHELIHPADRCYEAMRDGYAGLVVEAAHTAVEAFPEWRGVRLLAAVAQGTFWFLVMRADLGVRRGDLEAVKGRRIGAARMVGLGLRRVLIDSGIDPARDVELVGVPTRPGVSFGVNAAKALEEGAIDGFWANGMGAEVAVRRGAGTIVLDVRRGEGPPGAFGYTFAALSATAETVRREPEQAAACVRALARAHRVLARDPGLAAGIGQKLFPPYEAGLIAELVERDVPFYDATISAGAFASLCRFCRDMGLTKEPADYEAVVATRLRHLWKE